MADRQNCKYSKRSGIATPFRRYPGDLSPFEHIGKGHGYGLSLFSPLLAQMIPTSIEVWLSEGQKDTPEEIYEKLCRSIQMLGKWFA